MSRRRKILIAGGAIALALLVFFVLLLALPAGRTALVQWGLRFVVSHYGYHLAGGQFDLQARRLTINDLDIVDNRGEQFFTAKRITIDFDPAVFLGRSDRQFGLERIVLDEPRINVIHHEDGHWNYDPLIPTKPPSPAQPGAPHKPSVPLRLVMKVVDGKIIVYDPQAVVEVGRSFSIDGIAIDFSIDQQARTSGTLVSTLRSLRGDTPLNATFFEDTPLSFGRATIDVPAVPLAPVIDAMVPSPGFVQEGGVAEVHMRAYSLGWAPGAPRKWHLSGDAVIRIARAHLFPLIVPVRDITCRLRYQDGLLTTDGLSGMAGVVPVRAWGAINVIGQPHVAFSVDQVGDLERERSLFAFSAAQPVRGPFALAIRVSGPLNDVHIAGAYQLRDATYAGAKLPLVDGSFYFASGHMIVKAVDLAYNRARAWASGDFNLGSHETPIALVLAASAPANDLPFVANLNAGATAGLLATVSGPVANLSGSGYARLQGGGGAQLRTFFSADRQRLALGPLLYRAAQGGDIFLGISIAPRQGAPPLIGGELIASRAAVRVREGRATLADAGGFSLALPSLDTTLDGVALVLPAGDHPDVAIHLEAAPLVFDQIAFGSASLQAAGRNGLLRINRAIIRGPTTQASARGTLLLSSRLTVDAALLSGQASTNLSAFAPAFASMHPRGFMQGAFSAALNGRGWALSAQARSADASIGGVPIHSGSAVLSQFGTTTNLIANVAAAGNDVWAAGNVQNNTRSGMPTAHIAAIAPRIDLATLRSLGVPVPDGSAVGFATVRSGSGAPHMDAAAAISTSYENQPVTGDLDLEYSGNLVRSRGSRLSFDGNRAIIDGTVSGLGASQPLSADLALDVRIRNGNLGVANLFAGPNVQLGGPFDGGAHITGTTTHPQINGSIASNIGTLRGVPFNNLHGELQAQPGSIALKAASVELGSSQFALAGILSSRTFAVNATSPHVDMTDFNDFFGGADVFAGTGGFHMQMASGDEGLAWGGDFLLDDAAWHGYPLGHIATSFSSQRGSLHATFNQDGPVGATQLSGTVRFAQSSGLPNFATARYQVQANVAKLQLRPALALIHQQNLGVSGFLDAKGTLNGTLRNPTGNATFDLENGHIKSVPIDSFTATLASDSKGVTLKSASLALPYLRAAGDGRYEFKRHAITGRATLNSDDLPAVANAIHAPGSLGGSATGDVDASGTLDAPNLALHVNASKATLYGIAFDQANINATYAPGKLGIGDTSMIFAGHHGELSLSGNLPLQLHPFALGPKDKPVDLTMKAEKVDLSVFNPLVERFVTLTGNLNSEIAVRGNAGDPRVNGVSQIRYASIQSALQNQPISNVSADLKFNQDAINLTSMHASAGSGSIQAQGAARIVPAVGLRNTAGLQYWSRVDLRGAQIDVPGWVNGTFDGDLSVTRSGVTPFVSGSVAVSSATIPFSAIIDLATGSAAAAPPVPEQPPGVPPLRPGHTIVYGGSAWGKFPVTLTQTGEPTPAPTGIQLPPLDVNVAVKAGRDVRIRGGSAIDLTTTGDIIIAGNLRAPRLDGQFQSVRGQVGYFDTTFRLVSGTVTFDPSSGLLPTLNATAVTNSSAAQITLTITGRVDNLTMTLDADPPMTRDQIIATLLHAPTLGAIASAPQGQAPISLAQTAQSYFNAQLSRSLLYPFESALAEQLNIESVSFILNPRGEVALEVRTRVTPTISAVYQSTLAVPVTQSYGVSYRLRDYLALDFIGDQPNYGTNLTYLNLRYTFH